MADSTMSQHVWGSCCQQNCRWQERNLTSVTVGPPLTVPAAPVKQHSHIFIDGTACMFSAYRKKFQIKIQNTGLTKTSNMFSTESKLATSSANPHVAAAGWVCRVWTVESRQLRKEDPHNFANVTRRPYNCEKVSSTRYWSIASASYPMATRK